MRKPLRYAALALTFSAAQVSAHEVCGPRAKIVEDLGKQFGETVRFEGITREGHYLELFYSDKGGTYTAVVTEPSGRTCAIGSGVGNFRKNSDWAPTLEN